MQTINNITTSTQPTVASVAAALFIKYAGDMGSREAKMVERVAEYAVRDAQIFMKALKECNK